MSDIYHDRDRLQKAYQTNKLSQSQIEILEKCSGWTWEKEKDELQRYVNSSKLKVLSGVETLYQGLHRNWVDVVKIKCKKCGWWWWEDLVNIKFYFATKGNRFSCPWCAAHLDFITEKDLKRTLQNRISSYRLLNIEHIGHKGLFVKAKCTHCNEQFLTTLMCLITFNVFHFCPQSGYYNQNRRIEDANAIDEHWGRFAIYKNIQEASQVLGISSHAIRNCLSQKKLEVNGHHLQYYIDRDGHDVDMAEWHLWGHWDEILETHDD